MSFVAADGPVCTQLRKFGELVATPDLQVRLTCSVGHCRTECLKLDAFINHLKMEHAVEGAFIAHTEETLDRAVDEARFASERVESNSKAEEVDEDKSIAEVHMDEVFVKYEVDETALPVDESSVEASEQQSFDAERGNYATINNSLEMLARRGHCEELYPPYKVIADRVLKSLEPMFLRLTSEVEALGMEIQTLKNAGKPDLPICKIMPNIPFEVIDDFLAFEKSLQASKEVFQTFQHELKYVGIKPNFVTNCWKKILTDKVAEHFSWQGTEQKKSVRNFSTAIAIRNATSAKRIDEEFYIRGTKAFFQFAKNRQKQKINKKIVQINK